VNLRIDLRASVEQDKKNLLTKQIYEVIIFLMDFDIQKLYGGNE
jgi:hypothetical protein